MSSSASSILTPNERNGIRDIVLQLAAGLEKQGLSTTIILDEIDDIVSHISKQRKRLRSRDYVVPPSPILAVNRTARPTGDSLGVEDARKVNYRSCIRVLSHTLWTYVFNFLPLRDLLSVSHVCDAWRAQVVHVPRLWAQLEGLSGRAVDGLAVFLTRSKASPVHIELSVDLETMQDPAGLFVALAGHMWHTVSLVLSFPSMAEHQILQLQGVLGKEAPLLERLGILSPQDVRLMPDLFSRHAPRLTDVTLPIPSLPDRCDALSGVLSFTSSSPPSVSITHHEARRIFVLCPALKDLTLTCPLKYASPTNRKPYVITTIIDEPLITLCVPEFLASTVPYTLRTLNYEKIQRITIPNVSSATFNFIRKRMQPIEHVTFVRADIDAHVILIDVDGADRIFPATSHPVLDELLKSDQTMAGLTSLAMPDLLRVTDVSLLCDFVSFQHLSSITIFVGLVPPQSDMFREIYDMNEQNYSLTCPNLRMLRLSAFSPPCMNWSGPREDTCVSIEKVVSLVSFISKSLGFDSKTKLRRLELARVQLLVTGEKTLGDLLMLVDDVVM